MQPDYQNLYCSVIWRKSDALEGAIHTKYNLCIAVLIRSLTNYFLQFWRCIHLVSEWDDIKKKSQYVFHADINEAPCNLAKCVSSINETPLKKILAQRSSLDSAMSLPVFYVLMDSVFCKMGEGDPRPNFCFWFSNICYLFFICSCLDSFSDVTCISIIWILAFRYLSILFTYIWLFRVIC